MNMANAKYNTVIVGGGIAGLSTAWYLQKLAEEKGRSHSYIILEGSDRWGGKVMTHHIEDEKAGTFVVEAGPDSFLTQKPWALQLAREIGLEERLLGTNDDRRKTFVLNRKKLTPLPDGILLIVPTKIMPFALSPLISVLGKLRMGLDLFIRPKPDDNDETVAQFIKRRLGSEAVDKIGEPLLSGIYNAEAEKQSLLATFPRFRAIEKEHGSLIRGMLGSRKASQKRNPSASDKAPKLSMFVSLKAGMEELVATLVPRLNGELQLGSRVDRLEQNGSNFLVTTEDGRVVEVDNVVLAVPTFVAASLLTELAPESAGELDNFRYVSTGTISLAYRRDTFEHPLNGFGFVIPRSEKRPINAVTWSSTKFTDRVPDGNVLLRVFFGGSRTPHMMDIDDEELTAIVRRELDELMGVRAEPLFTSISRWTDATPQYDVGHLDRVDLIEGGLPNGIHLTGSPYRGIGLPDCVHQGQMTAEKIIGA